VFKFRQDEIKKMLWVEHVNTQTKYQNINIIKARAEKQKMCFFVVRHV